MSAALMVQKAIFESLSQDNDLVALLGGAHIYDNVEKNQQTPYVLFGKIESDDWSTGTEAGEEHLFELVVWSSAKGRKQVTQICEAMKSALALPPTTVGTHHLINLTWETTSTNRSKDNRYYTALIHFRAVTEPINS